MKKIYKNDKPISLSSKNIAKRHPNLVRRYANTFRGLNRMSGGISQEQIQKVKDFLTEYAESVNKLKYILLDKLCEHTIDTEYYLQYGENRYILEKINNAFIAKPELYKYDIAEIEHTDPDINFLIYALKLVSSFDSSVKKTQELEDVNSNFVFKKEFIPEKLLAIVDKDEFEKVYKDIEVERKQGVKPIPIRTPRQLIPLPRQLIPLPRQQPILLPRQLIPLPRMKETPDKVENKILEDSLELSRKIIVSPEEQIRLRQIKNRRMQRTLVGRLDKIPEEDEDQFGGRKPAKYKSTGITVYIMYKKKKYKRIIYVKEKAKTKTKYCKINNEYISLSKLKVVG